MVSIIIVTLATIRLRRFLGSVALRRLASSLVDFELSCTITLLLSLYVMSDDNNWMGLNDDRHNMGVKRRYANKI